MIRSIPFIVTCEVKNFPGIVGRPPRYEAYLEGLNYPVALQPIMWAHARKVDYTADVVRLGWTR